MPSCKRFQVVGLVQGVFYRASTQDKARQLQLTGWVRNCADGSVELVACGDDRQLAALEAWLRQGPRHARVDQVVVEPVSGEVYTDFSVRF